MDTACGRRNTISLALGRIERIRKAYTYYYNINIQINGARARMVQGGRTDHERPAMQPHRYIILYIPGDGSRPLKTHGQGEENGCFG